MTQLQPSALCYQDLTEFFNDKHPQLQNYLFWKVRSHEVAEELAQETYVRFLRQVKSQSILDLNAFLFTVAKNLAFDYLRTVKRQQKFEYIPIDGDMPDHKADTEALVDQQQLALRLEQTIADLPDKTREIFLLYRADELSYKNIAHRLDISERTVEYHLRRAVLHCRNALKESGMD
jgi:RNA polymerase sigma factor (sigma-70 family)